VTRPGRSLLLTLVSWLFAREADAVDVNANRAEEEAEEEEEETKPRREVEDFVNKELKSP
jgi:hypothetical protein